MAKSPFTEREVSTMIYGTIKQLVSDPCYFNNSNIGAEYSHLTELGKEALVKQMNLLCGHLSHAIKHDDIERAKQTVFEELKKEN